MKYKILKLSSGDFDLEDPLIVLDKTNINFNVGEGDTYEGEINLKDLSKKKIRGLCYSSSSRLQVKQKGFDLADPKINFTFNAKGLKPGTVFCERITLVTNGGEFICKVTAQIEKPYVLSSEGKIRNLDEFTYLAYKNFKEAHEIFKSKNFRKVIRYEEPFVRALYENMRTWSLGESALEEFLVGTKKKERLTISLSDYEKNYDEIPENNIDEIILFKSDWGNIAVSIISDGDFLEVEKSLYKGEDFIGNTLRIGYKINENKLHIGKNYGRLIIKTFYEEKEVSICVKNSGGIGEHLIEEKLSLIIRDYLRLQNSELSESDFFSKAEFSLSQIKEERKIIELFEAHLNLIVGKRTAAEDILVHFIWRREDLKREPILPLYYEYLFQKLDGEEKQREKLIASLNKFLKKNKDHEMASLMLVVIAPEYKVPENKNEYIRKMSNTGSNSILFLLEALKLYNEHPELIVEIGDFERRILKFALCYRLSGMYFIERCIYLAGRITTYDRRLTEILEKLYLVSESDLREEILPVITSQFIKGNVIRRRVHGFYLESILKDYKMARLYEFY